MQNSGTSNNTNPAIITISYFLEYIHTYRKHFSICMFDTLSQIISGFPAQKSSQTFVTFNVLFLVSKTGVIGVSRDHFLPSKCYEVVTALNVT